MQALPFSDALKLLSYLKEWTLYSDKVTLSAFSSKNFTVLQNFVYISSFLFFAACMQKSYPLSLWISSFLVKILQ